MGKPRVSRSWPPRLDAEMRKQLIRSGARPWMVTHDQAERTPRVTFCATWEEAMAKADAMAHGAAVIRSTLAS